MDFKYIYKSYYTTRIYFNQANLLKFNINVKKTAKFNIHVNLNKQLLKTVNGNIV